MGKIRVAIAGLGSCASALIQGVEYYKDQLEGDIPGLMHINFGGYYIRDIEFVAAFEVNSLKIGKDISEAIFMDPNLSAKFADVPHADVEVLPGPVADGVAPHMVEAFHLSPDHKAVDVASVLKETKAEMLVNYLPVGSARGTKMYAQAALDAECAFVNCIPEFVGLPRLVFLWQVTILRVRWGRQSFTGSWRSYSMTGVFTLTLLTS